ncbi:MAG: hypothetical protein ACYCPS_01065 [Candidatus Saccharimonadales bacterium]
MSGHETTIGVAKDAEGLRPTATSYAASVALARQVGSAYWQAIGRHLDEEPVAQDAAMPDPDNPYSEVFIGLAGGTGGSD